MKIHRATREYEEWLGKQLSIVPADLKLKHAHMSDDAFVFLRATFYRWAQHWPRVCKKINDVPVVHALADAHIENFGTWRDCEGRLIWGVNDFDEAYLLPYTNDLVRLATSAYLAIRDKRVSIRFKDACKAILDGYRRGLNKGGRPFVLGEEHPELRKMALGVLRDPVHFWQKLDGQTGKIEQNKIPEPVTGALDKMMPERQLKFNLVTRRAGEGSLGRERFVALAVWRGGRIAREAKALAPSAWTWANPSGANTSGIKYGEILESAIRCPDPFVTVVDRWVVRRLAPDCSRIDLSALPQERDERLLLNAMGFEIANVHIGSGPEAVRAVLTDLKQRQGDWLQSAAEAMAEATLKDWKAWRQKNASDD